jgi:DNA-binding MarR family transcriptional regulator
MQSLPSQPVGLLIAAARRRMKQAVGARARRFGLNAPQFWILVGVAERRGTALGALAGDLRLDAPTASRIVAGLVRKGLMRSSDDPADRRRCRIDLTARGRALAERLLPIAREAREAVVAGLSAMEHDTLRRLLHKVIANLDRFDAALERGAA